MYTNSFGSPLKESLAHDKFSIKTLTGRPGSPLPWLFQVSRHLLNLPHQLITMLTGVNPISSSRPGDGKRAAHTRAWTSHSLLLYTHTMLFSPPGSSWVKLHNSDNFGSLYSFVFFSTLSPLGEEQLSKTHFVAVGYDSASPSQ